MYCGLITKVEPRFKLPKLPNSVKSRNSLAKSGEAIDMVLKYDSALRLTNEVHYINGVNGSGGTQAENIRYGYDVSGNRILLSNGTSTFTNSILAGYRVGPVRNASTGATNETYGYDSGGRITNIVRSGVTLKLGYNSVDQLTAVTNGANWTNYTFDAAGRRVRATDQSGAQRRFLVAPAPTTDLECVHLVADSGNNFKAGYVLVGDDPLIRYDGAGANSRVYYLEDAMGSVIGLVSNGVSLARFTYDGFGKLRNAFGTSTNPLSGTGGDFRFHGQWLETATDLYHMRARDYDPRTGRFLSRDAHSGNFRLPETLHPYTYANNNPLIYSDPTGEFTMVEISLTTGTQFGGRSVQAVGAHVIKQRVRRQLTRAITKSLRDQIKDLIPNFDLPFPIPGDTGRDFETFARDAFRKLFCDELLDVPEWIYLQVPITVDGKALANGISCGRQATKREEAFFASFGAPRPDFVLSTQPPTKGGSWLIGDFKGRTGTLYREYLKPGTADGKKQLQAILNYARKNTYSKSALFVVATDRNSTKARVIRSELIKQGVSKGTLVMLVVID
jgi:RHS repeat-associated protein